MNDNKNSNDDSNINLKQRIVQCQHLGQIRQLSNMGLIIKIFPDGTIFFRNETGLYGRVRCLTRSGGDLQDFIWYSKETWEKGVLAFNGDLF